MKKRSLAAVAAFVFGCSVAATAFAADACDTCWARWNRCQGSGVQNCDYQLAQCLSKYGCPNPPW